MANHFSNAQGWTIGAHANFQAVTGNSTIIHNHPNLEREDRVTLHGRTVRRIIDGDIIFQRILLSEVLSVNVKPEGASTSTDLQVVKVKRTEQTAKIYGCRGKFTATTFEPVDGEDCVKFKEIVKVVLEAAMCGRSALLKQMFAVAESENAMTMIAHDGKFPVAIGYFGCGCSKASELVDGYKFVNRDWGEEEIVFYYLDYTLVCATSFELLDPAKECPQAIAVQALRDDGTLRFPVTNRFNDWSFNAKNLAWQYNPASLCLDPPTEDYLRPLLHPLSPLRQDIPLRQLDTAEIVAHVEESLGDVLHLVAPLGTSLITDLSLYARHGLLTFGTVINRCKPGILAHLPSLPSPEWFCHSDNPDVKASFSGSGRVDFSFRKTGDVRVELDFGWRIPEKDLSQLGCAFLCQSLHFCDDSGDARHCVVFVDRVGFCLQGTFPDDPTNCSTPAYLFVHPLPIDSVNNHPCVHYPFTKELFYWSHDSQGGNAIAKEDWERFGIPELSVKEWISSFWEEDGYALVQDHLCSRDHDLDGKQYAHEHRYPELIFADPHDTAMIEGLKDSNSDWETEASPSSSRPVSPSTPSIMEAPAKSTTDQCDGTPMLDINHDLAAATHIANKRQRTSAGGAIEPRRIHAEQQDFYHKNDETGHRQAFKEANVRFTSPLPRRDAFATQPGALSLNYTSAPRVNHPQDLHTGYDVPYGIRESGFIPYIPPDLSSTHVSVSTTDGVNGSATGSFPHSRDIDGARIQPQYTTTTNAFNDTYLQRNAHLGLNTINSNTPYHPHSLLNPTDSIYAEPIASSDTSYLPNVALSGIPHLTATNLNYIPLTAADDFSGMPTPSNHALSPNIPTDFSNKFAMHGRGTLSVPYGSVGRGGTTAPSSFHAGTISVGMTPQYDVPVDPTHSQWNLWGSSGTFHGDNSYAYPPLSNPAGSMGMPWPQPTATSLNHVPYTNVSNSHYHTPTANNYPSTAQDVLDPDGNASFVPYCGGGRVPQSSQQPPVYWPHTSSDGGGNQAPPSAFSAWN
ncbi:hypothetical protein PM082_001810 [Marasmius tenuissimus]|nr:hypothetical protein PM082_001810 [Marasmius tenuissimus]